MTDDPVGLARVELLGALTYGQLRAFVAAAQVVPLAPDVESAEELLAFVGRERERYDALRARLGELTDLPAPVIERQRPAFDRYFDALPLDSWRGAIVSLAVGLPIAGDFARAVAPTVDERTAEVILDALAGRSRMEQFTLDVVAGELADPEAAEDVRATVAEVVGLALTAFTGTLGETDALRVLFDEHAQREGVTGEVVVKRTALAVLEAHRRRMVALDLDDLDDLDDH